jgi:hypothetical protein
MTGPPGIRNASISGGLLALITVPVHLVLPQAVSELLAALVIAAIAGVYVGFAAAHGGVARVVLQGIVCPAFIGAAVLALVRAPLLLPALYIAHGLWDLAHHRSALPMPRWYVPLCLVYDVLAGLALWAIWAL